MIIKKFQGKTETEAVETAKKELGNNVVVMNVRNVKKKGLFSFLSPQLVEVTVALEEDNERYSVGNTRKDKPQEAFFAAASKGINPAAGDQEGGLNGFNNDEIDENFIKLNYPQLGQEQSVRRAGKSNPGANDLHYQRLTYSDRANQNAQNGGSKNTGNQYDNNPNQSNQYDNNPNQSNQYPHNMNQNSPHQSSPNQNNSNQNNRAKGTVNHGLEEKLDSLHSLLEQQLQKPEEEKKEEAAKEAPDELHVFMKLLYSTMLDNEINEKYANQIIEELEKTSKPNMPFDYALSNIYQKMILKFGKPSIIKPAESGPKVVFFIGPTGVGKTTTIAKIASSFRVEEHRKVALLTADTYRIAAAEQLRTYANILEVPFRVIYTKEEIEQAMSDYSGFDFILVDTAGHSHQNEGQRENMNNFIHSVDEMVEKEVFLVLSATTKYRDLVSIADSYAEMTDYKLIFTKLDETTTLGNLLNLKLYTGAPLSYMTYGQNVPDDIENFNPQKTVKQLLGGRK